MSSVKTSIRHVLNERQSGYDLRAQGLYGSFGGTSNMAKSEKIPAKDTLKVILTEKDLPGGKFSRETVEQCSVVQLKRWCLFV